jgi:hypothetical protein
LTGLAVVFVSASPASAGVALTASADGAWSQIDVLEGSYGQAAIYDTGRDRMIIFGGNPAFEPTTNRTFVWSRSFSPQWFSLDAIDNSDPIPPRALMASIYDPIRERMIVFGGKNGNVAYGDVWALSMAPGSRWTRLSPTGTGPTPRGDVIGVYDSARDRMLVIGGPAFQVWALSLSDPPAWEQLSPTGFVPSFKPPYWVAIYDASNDRVIVYGGGPGNAGAGWALSLSGNPAWSSFASPGAPGGITGGAYDPVGQRVLLFAGSLINGGADITSETWSLPLDGSPRTMLLGNAPTWRQWQSTTFDPSRQEVLMLGGIEYNANYISPAIWGLSLMGAPAWSLHSGDLPPPAIAPATFHLDVAIVDPLRDRLFASRAWRPGCCQGTEPIEGYLGVLELEGIPGWQRSNLYVSRDVSTVYSPRNDAIILFGGFDENFGWLDDTGVFPLGAEPSWTVDPASPRPPAGAPALVIDPRRDRLLAVYGGNVWALSLSSPHVWSQLDPGGPVPSVGYPVAAYDPVRDRVILCTNSNSNIWSLDLSGLPQWNLLAPTGTPPPLGFYQAIYDPVRDRMIFQGRGSELGASGTGTWALTLSDPPAWSSLLPQGTAPPPSGEFGGYEPRMDAVVQLFLDDINHVFAPWQLSFGEPSRPAANCEQASVLGDPGQAVNVSYQVTNGLGGPRAIGWKLECDRAWPGLPLRGIDVVDGGAAHDVPLSVTVPDTVSGVTAHLTFTTWFEGGFGYNASCQTAIVTAPVATLPSLESTDAEPGRVTLKWDLGTESSSSATVYRRRDDAADWTNLGAPEIESGRYAVYHDTDVVPGSVYWYELGIQQATGEVRLPAARVVVPGTFALALERLGPNPSRELRFAVELPKTGPASLEAFDVNGRRVASQSLQSMSAGRHELALNVPSLASGVYVVRLRQGVREAVTRAVIVR